MVASLHDIPGLHSQAVMLPAVSAGTATVEHTIFVAPTKCKVFRVSITGGASSDIGVANGSKNLNVLDKGSDGTGTDEIGNLNLASGGTFDEHEKTVIVTSLSTALAEGEVLALQVEKIGSGVAIPSSLILTEFVTA